MSSRFVFIFGIIIRRFSFKKNGVNECKNHTEYGFEWLFFISFVSLFFCYCFFFHSFSVNGHNVHQLRWARLVFIIYNAIIVCIVSSDMLQTISFRCVKVKNSDENCKHMSECDYNFRGVSVCVCVL